MAALYVIILGSRPFFFTPFACADGCTVRDRLGLPTLLLHPTEELQRPSPRTDGCSVRARMGLHALLLLLPKPLQRLLWMLAHLA
jgi:hypothetical protein